MIQTKFKQLKLIKKTEKKITGVKFSWTIIQSGGRKEFFLLLQLLYLLAVFAWRLDKTFLIILLCINSKGSEFNIKTGCISCYIKMQISGKIERMQKQSQG